MGGEVLRPAADISPRGPPRGGRRPGPRTRLFQAFADAFPSARIADSRLLAALWRAAFYAVGPREPFVMRAPHYRLWVDPRRRSMGRSVLLRGGIEPAETALFRSLLRPGLCVVDIGANIGHYTMIAAAALGGSGRVHAFEPEPAAFADLEANLRLNGFDNVSPCRRAVAERTGETTLYVDRRNWGGHSLHGGNVGAAAQPVTVETVSLDEAFAGGRTIDLLKMDTQGAEGRIVAGGRELLRRSDARILMEFWPAGLRRLGSDPRDLLGELADMGYRIAVIDGRSGAPVPTEADALLARPDLARPEGYADLFLEKR